jgi:nucleotide-binding universal stress UspA family protein
MLPIQTILHPTDLSECSGHAFQLACLLARGHGARVIVLHVMPVPLVQEKPLYREEMAGELNRLKASDPTIQVEYRLEEGDAVTQILRVAPGIKLRPDRLRDARKDGAGSAVDGQRCRTGFAHGLLSGTHSETSFPPAG